MPRGRGNASGWQKEESCWRHACRDRLRTLLYESAAAGVYRLRCRRTYLHRGAFEPPSQTKTENKIPIVGAVTRPGGRSAGNWSHNGSGTCVWNWGISSSQILCAPPSLLLPSHLPSQLPRTASCLGLCSSAAGITWKAGRFSGQDFPLQPDGTLRCPAEQSLTPRSSVEKLTEVCAWCMGPAFAVAAPVRCESSVNGMAVPPKSRAR